MTDDQDDARSQGEDVDIDRHPGGNIGYPRGFKVTGRDPQPGDGKRGRGRQS